MINNNFNDFVRNMYKISNNNTYVDRFLGVEYIRNCFTGRIYFCNSSPMFSEIKSIDNIIDNFKAEMITLIPRKNELDNELQVYEYEFKSYRIDNDILYITFKNGNVKNFNLK